MITNSFTRRPNRNTIIRITCSATWAWSIRIFSNSGNIHEGACTVRIIGGVIVISRRSKRSHRVRVNIVRWYVSMNNDGAENIYASVKKIERLWNGTGTGNLISIRSTIRGLTGVTWETLRGSFNNIFITTPLDATVPLQWNTRWTCPGFEETRNKLRRQRRSNTSSGQNKVITSKIRARAGTRNPPRSFKRRRNKNVETSPIHVQFSAFDKSMGHPPLGKNVS